MSDPNVSGTCDASSFAWPEQDAVTRWWNAHRHELCMAASQERLKSDKQVDNQRDTIMTTRRNALRTRMSHMEAKVKALEAAAGEAPPDDPGFDAIVDEAMPQATSDGEALLAKTIDSLATQLHVAHDVITAWREKSNNDAADLIGMERSRNEWRLQANLKYFRGEIFTLLNKYGSELMKVGCEQQRKSGISYIRSAKRAYLAKEVLDGYDGENPRKDEGE
jgi:hypothetical protein